jgi:antibiotic biosynthesis monooxygenase (ABM) superfamily enzyme
MYPHTTPIIQFETREARLARERIALHHADSAASSSASGAAPRYTLALLTWVAAYALITTFLSLLGPTIAGWPLAVRTLVLSVTMVAALTWVIMPRLTKLFRPWLAG